MKKFFTVLIVLIICSSFALFAGDGKTRIGTNVTYSSMYLPYGENESMGYQSKFKSDRLGLDLTVVREMSDKFAVDGSVYVFIGGEFNSNVGGSSSDSIIFQPSLGFKGGVAYRLGIFKLSGGLQYIHLRGEVGSTSGSAYLSFLGYYYGLDLDFKMGNTTRLILGAEMGDAFTAKLGMKYGGSTAETDLDLIHKFMQTGNLLFRAGLSWSI